RAVEQQGLDADGAVTAAHDRDRAVEHGEVRADAHVLRHVEVEPAVLLRHADAEQPQLREALDDLRRDAVTLVDVAAVDLERGEALQRLPEHLHELAALGIEAREGQHQLRRQLAEEQPAYQGLGHSSPSWPRRAGEASPHATTRAPRLT